MSMKHLYNSTCHNQFIRSKTWSSSTSKIDNKLLRIIILVINQYERFYIRVQLTNSLPVLSYGKLIETDKGGALVT